MEGQTFSGKKAADAGLVTGLVNGFDEMMETLDAEVAKQMEADEDNDKRHGDEVIEEQFEKYESASKRALKGLKINMSKPKVDDEEDDEDESDDDKGHPEVPMDSNKKLPVKMDDEGDDDDDGDDGEEPEADAKHHLVISDFDGTIKNEDEAESLNTAVARHLKKMDKAGRKVHVVTGRMESDRADVSHYLEKHEVPHAALHMKPEADAKMPTPQYKVEAVKRLEAEGHRIGHIVENDKACAEAYAEAGYHCVHPDTIARMDDEASDSEMGVTTDDKHDKQDAKKHKGRGIS
jgi:uncharacterized coiled-coil protein SlyX